MSFRRSVVLINCRFNQVSFRLSVSIKCRSINCRSTDIMLGKDAERKLALISPSNSPIQRKIKDLSNEVKCQVVVQIKTTPFSLFAIQIDKSTTSLRVYS